MSSCSQEVETFFLTSLHFMSHLNSMVRHFLRKEVFLKESFEISVSKLWNVANQASTWDFIAIAFLCIGTLLTLIDSFFSSKGFRRHSLYFFLVGALLWISSILIQSGALALLEVQKIGLVCFILFFFSLLLSIYAAWEWIKKNKRLGLVGVFISITAMILFTWD